MQTTTAVHFLARALVLVLLVVTAAAGAAPLTDQPAPPLALQVRAERDLAPTVGPAAATTELQGVEFRQDEDGAAYARLSAAGAQGTAPIAEWPAAAVLNSAQGALSFRFRSTAPAGKTGTLAFNWDGGGGGGWSFTVGEGPYEPPKDTKTATPATEVTAPPELLAPAGGAAPAPAAGLEEQRPPAATLNFVIYTRLRLNGLLDKHRTSQHLAARGAWHHLAYVWSSCTHAIYVDGNPIMTATGLSRLQPPSEPATARFRLASGSEADVADLRVYQRVLDWPALKALAGAAPAQYLAPLPPLRLWADWSVYTGRLVAYADTQALPAARMAAQVMTSSSSVMPTPPCTRSR